MRNPDFPAACRCARRARGPVLQVGLDRIPVSCTISRHGDGDGPPNSRRLSVDFPVAGAQSARRAFSSPAGHRAHRFGKDDPRRLLCRERMSLGIDGEGRRFNRLADRRPGSPSAFRIPCRPPGFPSQARLARWRTPPIRRNVAFARPGAHDRRSYRPAGEMDVGVVRVGVDRAGPHCSSARFRVCHGQCGPAVKRLAADCSLFAPRNRERRELRGGCTIHSVHRNPIVIQADEKRFGDGARPSGSFG